MPDPVQPFQFQQVQGRAPPVSFEGTCHSAGKTPRLCEQPEHRLANEFETLHSLLVVYGTRRLEPIRRAFHGGRTWSATLQKSGFTFMIQLLRHPKQDDNPGAKTPIPCSYSSNSLCL
jgi:hypothetical protein